jgi:hypothetical protein
MHFYTFLCLMQAAREDSGRKAKGEWFWTFNSVFTLGLEPFALCLFIVVR